MTDNIPFGEYIRQARLSLKPSLSLRKCAKTVDITAPYLSGIERGRLGSPAHDVILKIAEVLNINPDYLLFKGGKIPNDVINTLLENYEAIEAVRNLKRHNL